MRVNVPDAVGGKTVVGQLTVANASDAGYVTAFGCVDGIPRDAAGNVSRSDLNFDGRVRPVWSNRLIVKADVAGDVCFYTLRSVDMVIDVNAVSVDDGITSFPNRRTDTRLGGGPRVEAGGVLRVAAPEGVGGQTVIGQLTITNASGPGYVTAYGCKDGIPRDADGDVSRSDLNFDGRVRPVWSNRLIVQADADGDVCFFTSGRVHMVVDMNGVADVGITSFLNQRTDTRIASRSPVADSGTLRVHVAEAVGGKTVLGQLTTDSAAGYGYVTAYGCADGIPRDSAGNVSRSDLNFDGRVRPVWSNRLIVKADDDGYVCFFTLRRVDMIIDVNGVSATGISSFPNQRVDTRLGSPPPVTLLPGGDGIPVWPPYAPLPPLDGIAALTGEPTSAAIAARPIVAVKIDNFRIARPQWGLDVADAVIEENVEGVTRFIGLFQTRLPAQVGPVRSARTADLDLLNMMNRPIFGYSGANVGVTQWVRSAESSGVVVDFSAQRRPCYSRSPERPGPHNLLIDPTCAVSSSPTAGPARPLWTIDAAWRPGNGVASSADSTFQVPMDGVVVEWTWDAGASRYLRSQDGQPHVAVSGQRITARTVVEVLVHHVPSVVDARSPHPVTVGSGNAVVHRNGRAIPVTWSRSSPYAPFVFRHPGTGAEVPLNTGTTFLTLVRDR